jgi:hypothetical protein
MWRDFEYAWRLIENFAASEIGRIAILLALIPTAQIYAFLTLSISITLTRYASAQAIKILIKHRVQGLVFLVLLFTQYGIMLIESKFTLPVVATYVLILVNSGSVTDTAIKVYQEVNSLTLFPTARWGDWQWLFINLGRLGLAALFVASYLLKPLHQAISSLWARIVESDKPIFTLLFGGGAAAAKLIEAVIQAL